MGGAGVTEARLFSINGVDIRAADLPGSISADIVACELLHDCYGLDRIAFAPGDAVLDVGAHIGLFAAYVGLRYPDVSVHSFEPFPDNFKLLRENIERNRVSNVRIYPFAISGDGRLLKMATDPENSGGASCHTRTLTARAADMIPSATLDAIFDALGIESCRLLKIDCEGSEYEILLATRSLEKVEYLSGEFHSNDLLLAQGHTPEGLLRHCEKYIKPSKLTINWCEISQ
ncbi:MAG TPA: FkbM family methyltransferase [Pyrinomonadaceae bacterium]|jgi:FkbM family methyltransferase|nr:FkbM family methyltransferase [Pyrinomonadaceae bacterium]